MEEFRDIPGYEGLYQAGIYGNIKSLEKFKRTGVSRGFIQKERILKPVIDKWGYYYVCLKKDNNKKNIKIHKLVAITFLNYKSDGTHKIVIDHIINDKSNNRLDNLQLISQRENINKDRYKRNYSSSYLGVSFDKTYNKWQANIYIKDKLICLGRFKTEIEGNNIYQLAIANQDKFTGDKDVFRKLLMPEKYEKLSSNYKGVFYDKSRNKWAAQIQINKIQIVLGYFDTEIESFAMRQNAELKKDKFTGDKKQFRKLICSI